MSHCVTVKHRELHRSGQPLKLRGVNFGNWMLIEHFMIGLPWTDWRMRDAFQRILGDEAYHAFFDTYMDCYITEADFRFLAESGFNFVRLPFTYRHFEADGQPGQYLEDGFRYVDRVIEFCRRFDMFVMLDLHAAPGAQARDWNSESDFGESLFWREPHFRQRVVDLWRHVAGRYRDEERVFGYDMLGEPVAPDLTVLNRFTVDVIRAIREVDPNHIIAVEPNEWGKKIDSLHDEVFEDPLVIPSPHHYHSMFPPFGVLKEYPGEHEGKRYGREELAATLENIYDDERIDRPVLVGECGVHRRMINFNASLAMFDDLLSVFEEKGFHWAIWTYKDLGQMGLVSSKEKTPWKQFCSSPDVRVWQEEYRAAHSRFIDDLKQRLPALTTLDMRDLNTQIPHHWHAVTLPHVVELLKGKTPSALADMARSFAFENCDVHSDKLEVLRRHLQ